MSISPRTHAPEPTPVIVGKPSLADGGTALPTPVVITAGHEHCQRTRRHETVESVESALSRRDFYNDMNLGAFIKFSLEMTDKDNRAEFEKILAKAVKSATPDYAYQGCLSADHRSFAWIIDGVPDVRLRKKLLTAFAEGTEIGFTQMFKAGSRSSFHHVMDGIHGSNIDVQKAIYAAAGRALSKGFGTMAKESMEAIIDLLADINYLKDPHNLKPQLLTPIVMHLGKNAVHAAQVMSGLAAHTAFFSRMDVSAVTSFLDRSISSTGDKKVVPIPSAHTDGKAVAIVDTKHIARSAFADSAYVDIRPPFIPGQQQQQQLARPHRLESTANLFNARAHATLNTALQQQNISMCNRLVGEAYTIHRGMK